VYTTPTVLIDSTHTVSESGGFDCVPHIDNADNARLCLLWLIDILTSFVIRSSHCLSRGGVYMYVRETRNRQTTEP